MTTVYRYGFLAWFWRILIFGALIAGAGAVFLAVNTASPVLCVVAAPLVIPALFFGHVVATRADKQEDGSMRIWTLLFTRRKVARAELGVARVRLLAQATTTSIYAPRVWIPIKRRLPIYFDLLARFSDRQEFLKWWGVPRSALRP